MACRPKEHTRWWQRYIGHLQGPIVSINFEQLLISFNPD
nr:MAG TPA: hypothetical protein [Caudoviricetes sp.]